ncbi:thiolase family protein [Apilactobacillus ozensis]|uniref:acetyl-CoA C-acetyltransferase n=1 Tax=Apilactobacillus ozensis DSM 23829 = JCM 17196 TaxID=1423781 RepID=A0A0R2AYI9_9LACO|nr:thiolase family protein [Apilactobacillus ozensis]KRM69099.1 acetyl-CoA acetyltransferase [Apilactobacillus ozensis DSM 23829 = JCM 17196]MCK8607681.1 thiolase family protein [Apilactobacillus ozensis]
MNKKIVIVSAKRTPIGKLNGALKSLSAVDLGTAVSKSAIQELNLAEENIDQVIFGNVLQAGNGQNVARQIELNTGANFSSTANTINQVCGSGMKAIRNAQMEIQMGTADIIIAGGTESMSNAPFLNKNIRTEHKLGNISLVDSMLNDALTDAFSGKHMGITAENVAKKFNISRKEQDEWAFLSNQRAIAAQDNGWFQNEIVPIEVNESKNHFIMREDESIYRKTSLEKLSSLKTVFMEEGTVTAGNSSSINDGASALVLMSAAKAESLHLKPLATIEDYTEVGIDPDIMGYAPYYAIQKILNRNNLTVEDIDLFELNEAFASQVLAVSKNLNITPDKLNIAGGAIALGHPLGDSGARIITTLINNLKRTNKHSGIASICIGGGMGMAMQISVD